eukprot:CAMPEP_0204153096 /NCGR_PEP_ID=MMETSP0361-20130328/27561_1 /ASSEMBLY_ACC=CAM_ASM_000343 /TAXON_ID=268821 /ORGANISM="Scrippsiella Hangoei, Strain SHTV-5" /LENGTH=757 /DNA_ID=CAMNT_0051108167 /DNA_START=15 /DNA_END=2286 /DNA_ORIENTATION=+
MPAAPSPWDDEFFGDCEKEEYDAFFEEGGEERAKRQAPIARSAPSADIANGAADADGGIESEYAMLGRVGGSPTRSAAHDGGGSGTPAGASVGTSGAMTFSLEDDDDDDMSVDVSHCDDYDVKDCRPPELPEPPADFTAEDLRLREVLADFYFRHWADNVANINIIVKRYRGRAISHLWAQLASKYKVAPHDIVELMASTMYVSAPFEYTDQNQAEALERRLSGLQTSLVMALDTPEDRAELLRRCIETCASEGSDGVLRFLCFRGLHQGSSELRPQVWKLLLGCLPVNKPAEWRSMEGEMRSLYAKYKSEVLVVSNDLKFEVKVEHRRLMEAMQLLQQIQKDVDRTRQDVEHFKRPSTRVALISLLFVYAHVNPDMQYVQGMNEIAAVAFHVMSVDPEYEEADAFWCFTFLMRELKAGFITALEHSADKVASEVTILERLLRTYDPELARHLQKVSCPLATFTFRWCNMLFAQDLPLSEAVRLWDCFIADPQRFDVVAHVCLAALLSCREHLLNVQEPGAMHEVLRRVTTQADFDGWLRRAWAVCSCERRPQTPFFPQRSAGEVVSELTGWAQTAAAKAQELGAGVARSMQQNVAPVVQHVAPVVRERVAVASGSKAAQISGSVARGGLEAVKAWLEQDAPIQPENVAKAQTTVSSLWQVVRTSGGAAVSQTQRLAAEYGQGEKAEAAAARLSGARDAAATASSALSAAVVSRLQTAMSRKSERDAGEDGACAGGGGGGGGDRAGSVSQGGGAMYY